MPFQRTLQILVLVLVVGGAIALLVASGVGAAYANRALVPIRQSLMNQREALLRQREFASGRASTTWAAIRPSPWRAWGAP